MNATLRKGDTVTIQGSTRGRILAVSATGAKVLVQLHGSTKGRICAAEEVRRVNAWWNSTQKRAAFTGRARSGRGPATGRSRGRAPARRTRVAAAAARRTKVSRAAAAGGPGHDRKGAR